MQVFRTRKSIPRLRRPLVVSIGVFDGLHVGHQRLIRTAVRLAKRAGGSSLVITFDPDPQQVLRPSTIPLALIPLKARLEQLRQLGVDRTWVIRFTRSFARVRAEQFVTQVLMSRLQASVLVVGEGFLFGWERRGDVDTLRRIGRSGRLRVVAVGPVRRGGAVVSSSRIRQLIHEGRLSEARRLLGRPPTLYGSAISGAGRGRRFGIPTVNVRLASRVLPPSGVYAVRARLGTRTWPGVMNFGVRPTFGAGGPLVCETHLLGFSGTVPQGQAVALEVLARLRNERCFVSPAALVQQIQRDIARARRVITSQASRNPVRAAAAIR